MKKQIEKNVKRRVKGEARKKVQADKAAILEDGSEECDPQPLFEEIGFKAPMSMEDKIRQITMQVQAETAAKLAAQQMSEEEVQAILDEENNFEIPDSFEDTLTQYEAVGVLTDLEENVVLEATAPATQEPTATEEAVSQPTETTSTPSAEQSTEGATEAV